MGRTLGAGWFADRILLTVGLELKTRTYHGIAVQLKAAAVPMLCAVGGILVPPGSSRSSRCSRISAPGGVGELVIASGTDFPSVRCSHGWAVPTATDIAFSLGRAALVRHGAARFHPRIPMTSPRWTICWPSF